MITKRRVKPKNNRLEPIFDESLQLSDTQQLVVTVPIVPGRQIAEHAFVLVVTPSKVLLIF